MNEFLKRRSYHSSCRWRAFIRRWRPPRAASTPPSQAARRSTSKSWQRPIHLSLNSVVFSTRKGKAPRWRIRTQDQRRPCRFPDWIVIANNSNSTRALPPTPATRQAKLPKASKKASRARAPIKSCWRASTNSSKNECLSKRWHCQTSPARSRRKNEQYSATNWLTHTKYDQLIYPQIVY